MEFFFQNDFAYIFFVLAVIFGFILAFAVGANDSANSWGTPIGAGTISLRMAFLLGFVFETLGAMFLSSSWHSGGKPYRCTVMSSLKDKFEGGGNKANSLMIV